jgi:predicted nucleotidyltransferase
MRIALLDLSGKIDSLTVSALKQIQQIALHEHIPFFIVGATARDILLETAHGFEPKRATADIDIAVALESWTQFDFIKQALVQSYDFKPARKTERLLFQDILPVDFIPFGGVTESNNHISWPPDRSFKMSVIGFEECYRHSIPVKMADNPDLVIQVVSLPGLALLKLISWNDNPERRRRDAPDLFFIIQNYLDAGNLERFFEEAADLVADIEYDHELASALMLGRDISKIASMPTKKSLLEILERESQREEGHRIAIDVLQSDGYRWLDYERVVSCFDYLLKGLFH